jgi:8-amino-7-oxononanoate synthase
MLTSTLIRDYLLNYARPLIYSTSLSNASIIAASCSLDLLEDGTAERVRVLTLSFAFWLPLFIHAKLAAQVLDNSTYLQERFRASLSASSIPSHILTLPFRSQQQLSITTQLPSPIIPLLTPRPRALCVHLLAHGLNAYPISWPVVPKGTDRVRVCVHAGNTREQIDALVNASIAWAAGIGKDERGGPEGGRTGMKGSLKGTGPSGENAFRSKL